MAKTRGKVRDRERQKQKRKSKQNYLLSMSRKREQIRKFDDPSLKTKCNIVTEDDDYQGVIKNLIQVLKASKDGVGLSAPQIGLFKRVIVVQDSNEDIVPLINPEIIESSKDNVYGKEGCLSFPGHYFVIERPKEITVKYLDGEFKEQTTTFKNFQARIVCHEIDHLDGICKVGEMWAMKMAQERVKNLQRINKSTTPGEILGA